jgi:hypothetical protein
MKTREELLRQVVWCVYHLELDNRTTDGYLDVLDLEDETPGFITNLPSSVLYKKTEENIDYLEKAVEIFTKQGEQGLVELCLYGVEHGKKHLEKLNNSMLQSLNANIQSLEKELEEKEVEEVEETSSFLWKDVLNNLKLMFNEKMKNVTTIEELKQLQSFTIGKNSAVSEMLKSLGSFKSDLRVEVGMEINKIIAHVKENLQKKEKELEENVQESN